MMIRIDEHTFDETLLTETGWVIDAGCRGFNFTKWITKNKPRYSYLDFNYNVYAIDIDNFENTHATIFKQAALTHFSGETEAYFFGNGMGNFLKGINGEPENSEERPCETRKVKCITLQDIYNEIGIDIDLLKLDIEGAEYEVLLNMEPIPKQITVEFHEHCHRDLHNKYIDQVLVHLCKYYHLNLYIREWPLYKYVDCLFIRKDLL